MTFEVEHRAAGSAARAGRFTTDHGTVETPVFMPVGTAASVKGVFHRDLAEAGARIILANTYHPTCGRAWRSSKRREASTVSAHGTNRC